MDVEITVWAVNVTTVPDVVARVRECSGREAAPGQSKRDIFDPALGISVKASIILRDQMKSGQTVSGPAAITEDETTIILPSSRHAICQTDGCIDIHAKVQGSGS